MQSGNRSIVFFVLCCLMLPVRHAAAGTISGYCFFDADRDGRKSESENYVADVPLALNRMFLLLFPVTLVTVHSAQDGQFELSGLGSGLYQLALAGTGSASMEITNPRDQLVLIGLRQQNRIVRIGVYADNATTTTTSAPDNGTVSTTTTAADNGTSTTSVATGDNATSTTTMPGDNATSTTTTAGAAVTTSSSSTTSSGATGGERIGVLFIIHGGLEVMHDQFVWDGLMQIFSYDPNNLLYNQVIWGSTLWSSVLSSSVSIKLLKSYEFEYGRIGGIDPYYGISERLMDDLEDELNSSAGGDRQFYVDMAAYMAADRPAHYPYPRFMYKGPFGFKCDYCGEQEPGGAWAGCDPERYDVDGPIERLLAQGVTRIVAVDLVAGGTRFSKTYEVIKMAQRALDDWNAANHTSVKLSWVNDTDSLMEQSYPTSPSNWTRSSGEPKVDPPVSLSGASNPVVEDERLAELHVTGIEDALSESAGDNDTGVLLLNNALQDYYDLYYDPKIDDTQTLNQAIESRLLSAHPDMDADNIVGGYMGMKEDGLFSRTMRGEHTGLVYLYEQGGRAPSGKWGYRYWEALEYLKNRGVRHIVIAVPQLAISSVLDLVEIPNQIGKEIGYKTWLRWNAPDYGTYPGSGHPFADYWGNWANTDCNGAACCFEMGGCSDGRSYPPQPQADTPLDSREGILDPSLAYDVSAYGHLGFDESGSSGAPDPTAPVQSQYTGTWAMWSPPDTDAGLAALLAAHVLAELE